MATTAVIDPQRAATISVPANFRVTWQQADDAALCWTLQRMLSPEPVTPMAGEFIRVFDDSNNRALEAFAMPTRTRSRRINTYFYMATFNTPMSPEDVQTAATQSQEKLGPMMVELDDLWKRDWLPEIQRYLATWETFDLRSASLPDLLAHWDQMIAQHRRIWELHAQLGVLMFGALASFTHLYQHLFQDEDTLNALHLLQGFPNKTVESGDALWRLSRQALLSPEVRTILTQTPPAAVASTLERSHTGQAFLSMLQAYLEAYGRRGNRYFEVADPGWIEDPVPVLTTLKEYLAQPDRDRQVEQMARVAERERLVAKARERLTFQSPEMSGQFEFLLKAAQAATILQEDHGFWIDFRTMYEARRVLIEFGRRFTAAGVLDTPDGVFYLSFAELQETATAELPHDWRRLVGGRRAEMAYFSTITPPPALGTPPPPPAADDPVARMGAMFFGGPPLVQEHVDLVRGRAASAGVARGRARVVHTLAEATRLQVGDILVTPTTSPLWTPLFATVAAVVTDTGGLLSHCALVAREYGIPAVVGTGTGTTIIRDGQVLEVDGSAGIVHIICSA